ncbi:hypothetical protein GW796_07025 [archaeon]|nr:hypothetical protein [archaeon]
MIQENKNNFEKQDEFTKAYIVAAIWTSEPEDVDDNNTFDVIKIPQDILDLVSLECKTFQENNEKLLDAAYSSGKDYEASRAGHDLWLTRNGHGVGYWDRDLGEIGEKLSDKARELNGSDLYLGDDNNLYFSNLPKIKNVKVKMRK